MKKTILFLLGFIAYTNYSIAQWQQTSLDSGQISCFAISGNNIFAGSYDNGVFLSSDDGNNWAIVDSGLNNNTVFSLALSGNNIFAGTSNGVYLSSNNGQYWTAADTGLPNGEVEALAISGNNIFAGVSGSGVFMSSNNGQDWTMRNSGLISLWVHSMAISGNNIFVGTSVGVSLSSNNGQLWTLVNNGLPAANNFTDLLISGDNVFTGTYGGGLYITSDNGQIWEESGSFSNVGALAANGNNIFVSYSGVYMSSDTGQTWSNVSNGLPPTIDVSAIVVSGSYIYAGTYNDGIWRRTLSDILTIDEICDNNKIIVYPNPAKDKLTIESQQESIIEILNLHGQTILQRKIQQGKTDIDINILAKGIYILRLTSNDKTVLTRIVKE